MILGSFNPFNPCTNQPYSNILDIAHCPGAKKIAIMTFTKKYIQYKIITEIIIIRRNNGD
jgi:hypothetical protein